MDLNQTIAAYHDGLTRFVQGDPSPIMALYSRRDDVTLANPWGPARRGWADVSEALGLAASRFRDGGPQAEPHDTLALFAGTDLACLVENERLQARVGGRDELARFELRATTVFHLEDGTWKIVHRHADPVTTPNPDGPLRRAG